MSRRHDRSWNLYEGLITAIAVGGFFIVLGLVFVLTPGITGQTSSFFRDLTGVMYPVINGNIVLPAPANPAAHVGFFGAVINFMIAVGILQIVILALRLVFRSPIGRIAETVGNLVFWFGAAVAANVFLLAGTQNAWFQFWAWLIILVGVGLIARFLILFAAKSMRQSKEHQASKTTLPI